MRLKLLPFIVGIISFSAIANAETFESLEVEGEATTQTLNVKGTSYLTLNQKKQYFISAVNNEFPSYNTMFYVYGNGAIGGTSLHLQAQSAMHCCSPQLNIGIGDENEFKFSTSSYTAGPDAKYYPISFEAKEYLFDKGDMVVNGKITCKNEINVISLNTKDVNFNINNVADYVFDENYDLKSLSEVEAFVKENKHLPGVPSATEIEQNGVSLSQMSNLLLEKVEELTLHLIRLEKENAELKAKFESLEK
jgi:hypothetical protein